MSTQESIFVPQGLSIWEAGTNKDIESKANDDYEKRSKNPPSDVRSITFVFVTPFVWKGRDSWISKKVAAGAIWKAVKVIDGADLQDWLEQCTSVCLAYSRELGIAPLTGIQSAEDAWQNWSNLSQPPLTAELVTAGRAEQAKLLTDRLAARPSTTTVRADSSSEAWGFTLAVLRQLEKAGDRESALARTIVADDEVAADGIHSIENAIVLLKRVRNQVSGSLAARGCHVLVPEGNDFYGDDSHVLLSRPAHRQFVDALRSMFPEGTEISELESMARECGLSVTVLQRRRAVASVSPPDWASSKHSHLLVPALLAGRWSERNEHDKQIIAALADFEDYNKFEKSLRELLFVPDAPIRHIGEMWTLSAPVDAFQMVARYVSAHDLDRFAKAFQTVFQQFDPKVDLPPSQWLYQDAGTDNRHSTWLRSGLAEALLLIAERGNHARLECCSDPSAFVARVVSGIPGLQDNWRVLASIRDQYPRLIEAAPNPLLDSLEQLLEAHASDLKKLFAEDESVFGASPMHTGVLWGLEVLAWNPVHLPRVCLLLARLASIDPGGRWANRPINSLCEVLHWWVPGTNAGYDACLAVLDLILAKEPTVGWTLLAKLCPSGHSQVITPTLKPRWSDFGDPSPDHRSRKAKQIYVNAIYTRILDRIGDDVERWKVVLESLGSVSDQQRASATQTLDSIAAQVEDRSTKTLLWDAVREFTNKHATYSDAQWALGEDALNPLRRIAEKLSPESAVARHRWLFEDWLPDLPYPDQGSEKHSAYADEARKGAIKEILDEGGLTSVLALGKESRYPGLVADVLMSTIDKPSTSWTLAVQALSEGEPGVFFAMQLSRSADRKYGTTWRNIVVEAIKSHEIDETVAPSLLQLWPSDSDTWRLVEALGDSIATQFWKLCYIGQLSNEAEELSYQIEKLIEAGRAPFVFRTICWQALDVPSNLLLQVFDRTFEQLSQLKTAEDVRSTGIKSHDVLRYLEKLRGRGDLDTKEVAQREYNALPILSPLDAKGLILQSLMIKDAKFFVDVLCDVFLPASRDKSFDTEPTREQRAKAQAAFTLLDGLTDVPGFEDVKLVDAAALTSWILEVHSLSIAKDRQKIGEQRIGAVLAHAPKDPMDEAWPHAAVRDAIELLASPEVDRGLSIERFNMRGVTSRAHGEGGNQERELAQRYRNWANTCRPRWPRVAMLLDGIAEDWEHQGKWHDDHALQDEID